MGAHARTFGPLANIKPGQQLRAIRAEEYVLHNVRFWHLADIDAASKNVCFWGQSGHCVDPALQRE